MQVKLLHDLVEELAGEGTGEIVDILFGKKNVNEFLIAKKMDLTINQVRNILYKLSADNLVSFERKKDKRKGWYIYYWTLNTEKCLIKLEVSLIGKIEELNNVLQSRETKRFYVCKPCGIEVSEEKALDHGFTCEECAEVYELADNSGPIRDTKSKITRTEKALELIRGELEVLRDKVRKKKAREQSKKEKEEEEKKALIKEARAAARKKVAAKTAKVKTTSVKKTTTKKTTAKKVVAKKKPAKKVVKKTSIKKSVAKKPAKKKTATKKKVPAKKTVRKK